MTYRMLLNSSGLMISKPGVNVETANSPTQFLFNSTSAEYLGLFASGQLNPASFPSEVSQILDTSVSTTLRAYDLYYGKTFAAPPLVLVMYLSGNTTGGGPGFDEVNEWLVTTNGIQTTQGGGTVAGVRSYTDHVRFEFSAASGVPYITNGPAAISYLICQK